MKYCNDYAALLDLYVDGELDAGDMIRVQEHIDSCPGCRAYVDDALAIRAAFPNAEETPVPDGFTETVMSAVRANPRRSRKTAPWAKTLVPLAACLAIVVALRSGPFPSAKMQDSAVFRTEESMTETAAQAPVAPSDYFRKEDAKSTLKPEAQAEAPAAAQGGMAAPAEDPMAAPTEMLEDTVLESNSAAPESKDADRSETAGYAPEVPASDNASFDDSAYAAVLYLPAECAPFLAELTPLEETDAEQRYILSAAQHEALLPMLEGIVYITEIRVAPVSDAVLVVLEK